MRKRIINIFQQWKNPTWSQAGDWTSQMTEDLALKAIPIPLNMSCDGNKGECVGCTEILYWETELLDYFSNQGVNEIENSVNYEEIFSNYLNHKHCCPIKLFKKKPAMLTS